MFNRLKMATLEFHTHTIILKQDKSKKKNNNKNLILQRYLLTNDKNIFYFLLHIKFDHSSKNHPITILIRIFISGKGIGIYNI